MSIDSHFSRKKYINKYTCSLFLVFKQNHVDDVDVIFIAYSYRLL